MAIARDASSPAAVPGDATSVTSASFTAPAGSIITVRIAQDGTTGVSITGISDTGGLTWNQKVNQLGTNGSITRIYWAYAATSAARTITVTFGSAFQSETKIDVWTGCAQDQGPGASNGALNTFAAPSVSYTAFATGSMGIATSDDFNASGLGTAGSGCTLDDERHVVGNATEHNLKRTTADGVAGATTTLNMTAPTGQDYAIAAMEIIPPAGGGPVWSQPTPGVGLPNALGGARAAVARASRW